MLFRSVSQSRYVRLGGIVSNEEEAKLEAIQILKKDYNIEYNIDEIKFEWGGRL